MAAEALQSLNRILQYREQRQDTRVSQALAFMELSQQKEFQKAKLKLQREQLTGMVGGEETISKQQLEISRKGEARKEELFERTKFEENIDFFKQHQKKTGVDLANTFVKKFGFQEANAMAQTEGVETSSISSLVNPVLKKIAPDLNTKERQFLATRISGSLFSSAQMADSAPLIELLDSYGDSLTKRANKEKLTIGESRLYNSLTKFTNINELVKLAEIANKHRIIDSAIFREEQEYRLKGDMDIPENILYGTLPELDIKKTPREELESRQKTVDNSLLKIGDINNLKEKTVIDLDGAHKTRQQLMDAAEQRYSIQQAIRKAESTPPDRRTPEENQLIFNKDDFLEQADSTILSLENSLNLIEDELDNDMYQSERLRSDADIRQRNIPKP